MELDIPESIRELSFMINLNHKAYRGERKHIGVMVHNREPISKWMHRRDVANKTKSMFAALSPEEHKSLIAWDSANRSKAPGYYQILPTYIMDSRAASIIRENAREDCVRWRAANPHSPFRSFRQDPSPLAADPVREQADPVRVPADIHFSQYEYNDFDLVFEMDI